MTSVHIDVLIAGTGTLSASPVVNPPTELTFFEVVGNFRDIEMPDPSGSSNQVLTNIVTGSVTFYPRLPLGFVTYVANMPIGGTTTGNLPITGNVTIALAPIPARILSGQLQTIDVSDTPGIQLLANSPALNLAAQGIASLIYDVAFSNVVFSDAAQQIANFAFTAPATSQQIDLSSPALARLTYAGP